jgi:DHA2 family multidrug resistance protein
MWAFGSAAAPALGLAFGGPMVEALSWRGVFIAQGALALLFLPLCLRWLDETKRRSNIGFDVLGGITLMLATGSILLYLDRGGTWGWTNPVELALLVAAPILGVAFFRIERVAKFPLLPAGLLANPAYSMPAVSEFLSQASSNAVFFSAPLLLTQRFEKSVAETAFLMLPLPLGMCFGAIIGGRVAARFGERRGGLIGTSAMALSMALFLIGYNTEIMIVVTIALIVQGIANGFVRPAVASAGGAALSPEYFGVGMATLRMIALLGSTMGISIALAASVIGGFRGIYITTFVLAVLATLTMTRVVSHKRITGTPEERRSQERELLAEMQTEAGLTTLPAFEG